MQEIVLNSIKNMREDDFTKDILIPLFYKLGYEKVIYNGGVNENGKDIICWKTDEIGDKEVTTVQVKMKDLSTSSSSNSSFSTVINQLHQASEEAIKNEDGLEYLPSVVYYISPVIIRTRELETRFKPVSTNTKLKMIGGDKLYKLMNMHMPEYINKLTGNVDSLQETLISEICNDELFSALNIFDKKEAVEYYSNLDINYLSRLISIDTIDEVSNDNKALCILNDEEWKAFLKIFNTVKEKTSLFNSIIKINDIESTHKISNLSQNIKLVKDLKEQYKNIDKVDINLKKFLNDFKSHLENEKDIKISDTRVEDVENKKYTELYEKFKAFELSCEVFIKKIINIKNINFYIHDKELIIKHIEHAFNNVQASYKDLLQNKIVKSSQLKPMLIEIHFMLEEFYRISSYTIVLKEKTIEIQKYFFILDFKLIEKCINRLLLYNIKFLRQEKSFINTLLELNQISSDIYKLSNLFRNFEISYISIRDEQNLRIEKHVSDLLDKDISLFIEGNAGAGKTTTLQHYAYKNENKQSLYIPLSKLSSIIKSEGVIDNYLDELINAIVKYITSKKINIDKLKFIELLQKDDTVLLLDGLDEIIIRHHWIFEAIVALKNKYKTLTCVTSRPGYVSDKKNLIFIQLMEFNDVQQNKFILGWFKNKKRMANDLLKHIKNNSLSELIKNPLVATIYCSLFEKEIPLPSTETTLYEERFRLLFGDYDFQKKISRNKSHRRDLEYFAIKIAFIFHKAKTRALEKHDIIIRLTQLLTSKYTEYAIEKIVDELILPCNILFEDDNKYTFGHLRYQEYLVAKEFQNNRGLEIKSYTTDYWWEGALVLFSQMTDDFKFIVDDIIYDNHEIKNHEKILTSMIEVRPLTEQKELFQLIANYNSLEEEIDMFNEYE